MTAFVQSVVQEQSKPKSSLEIILDSQAFSVVLGVILTAIVATAGFLITSSLKRKREGREKAALLFLFALESSHLFHRFVQYSKQIIEGAVSRSRPYEMIPPSGVTRLVELETSHKTLAAIYQVKEINALVTTNSDRAHNILAQEYYEELRIKHQLSIEPIRKNKSPVAANMGTDTYGSIFQFVSDEYRETVKAVEHLLNEAELAKGESLVAPLKLMFTEDKRDYEQVLKKLGGERSPQGKTKAG